MHEFDEGDQRFLNLCVLDVVEGMIQMLAGVEGRGEEDGLSESELEYVLTNANERLAAKKMLGLISEKEMKLAAKVLAVINKKEE